MVAWPGHILRLPLSFLLWHRLDPLGHHAISCRHGEFVVLRHKHLHDTIANFCHCAHLSVEVEMGYGLSPSHSNSCPADIHVQGWDRGRPAAFDVTVTSPLTPAILKETSASAGAAAHIAETRKHSASDAMCEELGWVCIPLAVESYGNWGMEAHSTLKRLASLIAIYESCIMASVSSELYGHLNLSLVRSVARAIMGRESMGVGC